MWFDCNNVLINLEHVDYVSFETTEDGNCKAVVFFESGDSLNFAHTDMNFLKQHFRRIMENDSR